MTTDHHTGDSHPHSTATSTSADRFRAAVEHAAHLLPAQGPITVFIHHNTLHAFEHLTFEEAVARGAAVFGCEPYLSEERYREALAKGRIRFADLRAELDEELGAGAAEGIPPAGTRLDLRLALLQYPLATGSSAELQWAIAESDALRKVRQEASAASRLRLISETRRWVMRDLRSRNGSNPEWVQALFDRFGLTRIERWSEATWEAFALEALWNVCCDGARAVPTPQPAPLPSVRPRDLIHRETGIDTDLPVHDLLTRFTAAFLDQGVSHWPLPDRERGFFHSFCTLYGRSGGSPERWVREMAREAGRYLATGVGAADAACQSLAALGIPESDWGEYVAGSLLALRGWGGMVHQVELRGDRVPHPIPGGSLIEFVAVRLMLERFVVAHVARAELGDTGPLADLRDSLRARAQRTTPPGAPERAYPVFQLAQLFGWSPAELTRLTAGEWVLLFREVDAFPSVQRRRVYHRAYERRFREQCLDALVLHDRREVKEPAFQAIACIDDREESFRRHMEEIAPDCETFGAAGFFAVPMYYRGSTDAHFIPLCPIVITPKHWVEEQPEEHAQESHRRLRRAQRWFGSTAHRAHVGSRTFLLGAVLAATLGVIAWVPLVLRILFPRLTARFRGGVGRVVGPASSTRLKLERVPECVPGDQPANLGFTVEEMTTQAERLLRDIGLLSGFAPLVFVIGHGSNSLNNPHKSAYDCGACGGSPGAPNGRAAAEILNDPRVREGLAARGIPIPVQTWFVGGYHNTCDDSVTLFDTERVPVVHRGRLAEVRRVFELACDRNAHERCRRFMSAPLTITPSEARRHVEARSEDLAQTRPELGHATNALCVVARRSRSRGLFLDRRAFLTSYDPTQDDAVATVLTRTLQAVFPVCGGINLEYYFSHVDSAGYGCGTKLPHNVTSLLGVMDGAASDLRTGLPWQMVEIHEPVRLLIICETTPEVMLGILNRNPMMHAMATNGWVQLAVLDPAGPTVRVFQNGEFRPYVPGANVLPLATTSAGWYRGWRDHLEFAEIGSGAGGGSGG